MATWIQLKDGVAFAHVESENFVGNSIPLEDGKTFQDVIAKKYENGSWVNAPLIYFVEEMFGDKVMRVNSTVYASDVKGDIVSDDVKPMWTKNANGEFVPPATIADATIHDEALFN